MTAINTKPISNILYRTFQLPIIDMNSSFELAEWLVHSLARAQYKLDYVSWGLMSFAIVGSINQLRS